MKAFWDDIKFIVLDFLDSLAIFIDDLILVSRLIVLDFWENIKDTYRALKEEFKR